METTTENSSMFTLEMLTKQAPTAPAEVEEAPAVSLPHVFTPVLAAPAPVAARKATRVSGWVFVAAFVAFIAPVVGVVAFLETKTAAPRAARPTTTNVVETAVETSTIPSTTTSTATSTTATPEAPTRSPNLHHVPRTTTIATATATTVKREAPKCCPGETEMQCAMRRSVGATCG